MGRPTPNVLLVETFRHPRSGEHVDEVRFHEPVVITAVEIMKLNAPSQCRSVTLSGVSSAQAFSVEIFVRSGGDTRFKRLCHPFLYSSTAPPFRDVQLAVTDHLVIRGTYDSLTVVLYGNSSIDIGQLSGNHDLDSALPNSLQSEASCGIEDLPEALHPPKGKLGSFRPLQHLHLVLDDQDQILFIRRLLQLAELVGRASSDVPMMNKLVKVLVSAVTSLQVSTTRFSTFLSSRPWPSSANMASVEGRETSKLPQGLLDAKRELEELRDELLNREEGKLHEYARDGAEAGHERKNAGDQGITVEVETPDSVLEFILFWIQDGLQPSEVLVPALFPVKRLIGGLAAAQLLCTGSKDCYRFVASGGMSLLTDVIQQVSGKFSITTLLALGVVECASRFAFGCEALLGWWSPTASDALPGSSTGYQILLNLLLQPHLQHVAHLASQVLHRLRAYELTAVIQSSVDSIVEEPAKTQTRSRDEDDDSKVLGKALAASKLLLELVNSKGTVEKGGTAARFSRWLALDTEDVGNFLPSYAAYGATATLNPVNARQDVDPFLLSVLQERRLLPLLAALVSAPRFRSSQGYVMNLCVEFVGVIEVLLLALLNCRSGVLFLTNDLEAAIALMDSFQWMKEVHEKDLPPLRHSLALTAAGFLCRHQDIGAMLQTCFSVMSSMDRLLTLSNRSDDPLWALWELCKVSRQAIGKQAILMMAWFPEVIQLLVSALSGPDSDLVFGETWKRPAIHLVAKVFQVLVSDPAASSVAAWIPYATAIHRALLPNTGPVECISEGGYADKDGACSVLLEWLDSALVYQKKGAVGLLKYASAISAGVIGNPPASAGIHGGDSMDIDSNTGDQGGNFELPNVVIPFQAKWGGNDTSAATLTDTAIVQLTVAFRILSVVSSYPGMAAVLYGEGATAVVHFVLNHCATALTTVPNDYDVMTDEDMEDDAEDLANHRKERLVLRLLLPTLTFLLTLCRSLQQATVEDYQNTKLVDVLLALHHCISARSATYASVPPHTWAGITQELVAVHHVLASVLVCWPIYGWAPALFPRLLGANNSSTASSSILLPMEPGKTCSVLSLLADMLPHEIPQTCGTRTALVEMYRSLTVGSFLGVPTATAVSWHTQSPHVEKLLRALSPHLDQIAEIVLHHASTICGVLQGMLKLFVIRLACKNMDHAAVIVRPILNQIREESSCSVSGLGKEKLQVRQVLELAKVDRLIQMVAGLALYPATKQVLLREGAIEVLVNFSEFGVQFLTGEKAPPPADGDASSMGWCQWVMRAFGAICDPDVSMRPSDTVGRRILYDCPSFGDCFSVASCLLSLLRVLPLGKDVEYVLDAFGKLASHKLGRAAIASTTMRSRDQMFNVEEGVGDPRKLTQPNGDASLPSKSVTPGENFSSSFLDLWRRILTSIEGDQCAGSLVTNIIRHAALSGIILCAAGKSACGVGALKLLFGLGLGLPNGGEQNLKPVVDVIAILQQCACDDAPRPSEKPTSMSGVSVSSLKEACTAQMTMLRILKRTESVNALTLKVHEIMQRYSGPQTSGRGSNGTKVAQHISVLPALVSLKENLDVEKDTPLSDETLSGMESEPSVAESRGRLVWECPAVSQDRPVLAVSSSKRKTISMIEVGKKRYRTDSSASFNSAAELTPGVGTPGAGRAVPASASLVPVLSRRDTFRQRKPNTSRPPSMHVDDYVARERSSDVPTGSSPAPVQQRSTSGSGRPPSIHVDEFMARQQERQQLSAAGNTASELQTGGRNLSLPSVDSGRKETVDGIGKVSDDNGLGQQTQPALASHVKKDDSVKHEISVVDSAAVGPSICTDLPEVSSSVPDVKTENTGILTGSMSAATDSHQGDKTPQVAEMMLLQSKVTMQASVSQSVGGSSSARSEERVQAAGSAGEEPVRISATNSSTSSGMPAMSGKSRGMMPLVNFAGTDLQSGSRITANEVPQSAQREPEFHVSSMSQMDTRQSSVFPPQDVSGAPTSLEIHVSSISEYGGTGRPSHSHLRSVDSQPTSVPVLSRRESGMPLLDFQGRPINLASLVRDVRHLLPTSVRSDTQSNSQNPSPALIQRENSPQVNAGTRGIISVDPRSNSAPATDPRLGLHSDSASQATDPRPRPPDMHREKKLTNSPATAVQVLPPPPPVWAPTDSGQRKDSTVLAPPPTILSPRPNPPTYGPHQVNSGAPRAPTEVTGVAVPIPQASGTSWSGKYPGARFFEDAANSYNTTQRLSQPQPPLPVGQSPTIHGAIQGMGNLSSPHPPQHALSASNIPMESRAGSSISGSHVPVGDRRYGIPLQGYALISPPPLQPTAYLAPPVPAGRPTTPQVPVNVTTHQQLMQLQQQQSIVQQLHQQQQQQLQARQLPLQQHTAAQHMQQMQGPQMPMHMAVQGLVLPPPPPPPLPPSLQQQHRLQQQEPSALLQQMLASPDAIQALLKDQNKLRELLEQHPKLISLLQEKMSQASSQ